MKPTTPTSSAHAADPGFIRNQTAQLRGVDGQVPFAASNLAQSRLTIDRRRQLIERHLNHRDGNTAFSPPRSCTGFITFPVEFWPVQKCVGMRVNHAAGSNQSRRISTFSLPRGSRQSRWPFPRTAISITLASFFLE